MVDPTEFPNYDNAMRYVDRIKSHIKDLNANMCTSACVTYVWSGDEWIKCDPYTILRTTLSRKFNAKLAFSYKLVIKLYTRPIVISDIDLAIFIALGMTFPEKLILGRAIYETKYIPLKNCKLTSNRDSECVISQYKKEDYSVYKLNVTLTQADIDSFSDEHLFFLEVVKDVKTFTILIRQILTYSGHAICFKGQYDGHPLLAILRHIFYPNVREIGQRRKLIGAPTLHFRNCKDHISLYWCHLYCGKNAMVVKLVKMEPLPQEKIEKLAQWLVYNMARTLRQSIRVRYR